DARESIARQLSTPGPERIWVVGDAFRVGMSVDEIFQISRIDPWFLVQIEDLIREEAAVAAGTFSDLSKDRLYALKRKGFSDARLAQLLGVKEQDVRSRRRDLGVQPVFKRVDTCAAEFPTATAYMYSTFD